MELTRVSVYLAKPSDYPVKAYAEIVLDGVFVMEGIRVVCNKEGKLFIGMPYRKDSEGNKRDIVYPINSATREFLTEKILAVYYNNKENKDAYYKKKKQKRKKIVCSEE